MGSFFQNVASLFSVPAQRPTIEPLTPQELREKLNQIVPSGGRTYFSGDHPRYIAAKSEYESCMNADLLRRSLDCREVFFQALDEGDKGCSDYPTYDKKRSLVVHGESLPWSERSTLHLLDSIFNGSEKNSVKKAAKLCLLVDRTTTTAEHPFDRYRSQLSRCLAFTAYGSPEAHACARHFLKQFKLDPQDAV